MTHAAQTGKIGINCVNFEDVSWWMVSIGRGMPFAMVNHSLTRSNQNEKTSTMNEIVSQLKTDGISMISLNFEIS